MSLAPEEWTELAACASLEVEMFPSVRDARGQRAAKAVCRRCPVVMQCLDLGLRQDAQGRTEERWGIFGSLNGPQRGRLAAKINRRRGIPTRRDLEAIEAEMPVLDKRPRAPRARQGTAQGTEGTRSCPVSDAS